MTKPKPIQIILMILIALLLYFGEGQAQNDNSWYVGNDGSDASNGWTPATAQQTLNGGILDSLSAGDTLYIMGGTWSEHESSSCTYVWDCAFEVYGIDGSAGSPIVIRNYSDSSMPVFDGDGAAGVDTCNQSSEGGYRGISVCNSSYIVFDSLWVTDFCQYGFLIRNATNITVQNCQIDSCYSTDGGLVGGGVYIGGAFELSDSNTIQHCNFNGNNGGHDNNPGVMLNNANYNTIRANEIYNGYTGIRLKVDTNCYNWIDSNLIHDNGRGIEMGSTNDSNTFCFNVIWDCAFGIYKFHHYGPSAYNKYYNNTIYGGTEYNGGRGIGLGMGFSSLSVQEFQNASWFNNISYYYSPNDGRHTSFVLEDTASDGDTNTFEILDYNCYFGTSSSDTDVVGFKNNLMSLLEWQTTGPYGYDQNTIWEDPGFLSTDDATDTFLMIDNTSPCATSGRGGSYPSYMGAYAPPGSPPDSLNTIALDSLINDHTGETDSVLVITATPNTFGDYVKVAISTTSYPVSGDTKSDSVAYQDNHTDTMRVEFTANEPCSLYVSGWVWSADSGYSARLTNSLYFSPGAPTDTPDVLVSLDMDSSLNDYSGEFDSIQIIDSTGDETYPDSVIFTWSLSFCCPDSNSSNRRTHAYSNNTKTDSMYIVDDVIEPGWLYLSGWVMDTDSGWSPRTQDSIFFFRPIKLFLMRK